MHTTRLTLAKPDEDKRRHSQATRTFVVELLRGAFGVRGACSRFRTALRLTTAPASWTHSKRFVQVGCALAALLVLAVLSSSGAQPSAQTGSSVVESAEAVPPYKDGRPTAKYRLKAIDQGVVLRHGDGPGKCDYLGARDIWVFEDAGTYYMHYDG